MMPSNEEQFHAKIVLSEGFNPTLSKIFINYHFKHHTAFILAIGVQN